MRGVFRRVNDLVEWGTGRRLLRVEKDERHDLSRTLNFLRSYLPTDATDDTLSFRRFLIENFQNSNAQLFQDLWVLWELDLHKHGYFVEFGAFDGRRLSNTFLLEKEYGWRGVLAEPNPEMHDAIRENRSAILDERCVLTTSGDRIDLIVTHEAEYSSIDRHTQSDSHAPLRSRGRRVSVPTVSLADLLHEHDAPPVIDYMSIDTEGSELEILKAYDWSRHIRCLSIEHNHTRNHESIDELLHRYGYVRRFADLSKWDAWYIHGDDESFRRNR